MHLFAAPRHPLTPPRSDDPSPAITTAAPPSCPHHSTAHRVLRSARGVGATPRRDRSRPPWALEAGASTPPCSPGGSQVLFFEFFHDCGRTDVQHPRGIANAAGIHGHIHDLLLDVRRLPCVGIREEKCTPTIRARPAPIPLLPFRRCAMPNDIRAVAVGTVQHLGHHRCSRSHGRFYSAQTPIKDTRSTALKHLRTFYSGNMRPGPEENARGAQDVKRHDLSLP